MAKATISTARQAEGMARDAGVPHPHELTPFVARAPLQVMVRSCLEWLIDEQTMQRLFDEVAQGQYTRALTLDFMVDTMLDVACGRHPSAGAALAAYRDRMQVTRQAFYAKLNRMEPAVGEAIVAHVASLAHNVISELRAAQNEPISGFCACVVDGTYLGGRTEHRIKALRQTGSAGLTGMALAVFALGSRTVRQVILQENAYTQERALLKDLQIGAGEVWIGDRNFCVRSWLSRVHRAQSRFVVRWHRSACPFEAIDELHDAPGSKQGAREQRIWLDDPSTGERMQARRIELALNTPTRNGDTTLVLVTDLPDSVEADTCCDLYRNRWRIETHYLRLTRQLHCEPAGLNHPRAALFAFAMAVVAGNALAVVQSALQAEHGRAAVEELSYYYMVLVVASVWEGMSIAVPGHHWDFVRRYPPGELALWLRALAKSVPIEHFRRSHRGPKKPPTERQSGAHQRHVSVKRLLDMAT